jgi:hypothetical protein
MPHAQKARLIQATTEYLQAYQGDGRGHSTKHFGDEPIREAKQLLDRLGGHQDVRGDTPGRRASGSTGEGPPNFNPPVAE